MPIPVARLNHAVLFVRDASVSADVGAVRTTLPSRRTVTKSASSRTSRRKWEISTIVVSRRASERTMSWSWAVSGALSAADGSSMTMSRALRSPATSWITAGAVHAE